MSSKIQAISIKTQLDHSITPTRNPIKKFFCWIGWHGTRTHLRMDGFSIHAKCDWCGYEGRVDSRGDLS